MVNLINKQIKHIGVLGVGTVTEQDNRYITVEFASKTSKFAYPIAFEKFLIPVDRADADAIKKELEEAKAAEAAKRVDEDQTKLKILKDQVAVSGKRVSSIKEHVTVKRVAGQAMTYLVFQGDTYNEEKTGQFIWAPKFTKDGRTMHHWDRLLDVREGDIIFHCSDGYIQAISRVKAACEDSARPDNSTADWTNWEKDGRRVNCDYHVLKYPLKYGTHKEKILEYCKEKYAPFNKDGNGNMGYLYDLNQGLASYFIQEIIKKNPEIIDLEYLKFILVK
ncbi:hypothetical protein [Brotaphodocola sp.]|uniref:hypothetical protein n=1 Tax=Brotaphodocola sp. TaxID=3073577 RepID=UPI003D7CEAE6